MKPRPPSKPHPTPEDLAHSTHITISTNPRSTECVIIQLRKYADVYGMPGFDTLAARLEGTAPKPGPKPIPTDVAALQRVDELKRTGDPRAAAGRVANIIAPGDPRLRDTIVHRLRRKLREKRTD